MNILLISNSLFPSGGDWTYIENVAKIYKQHGHNVYMWGLKNSKNKDNTYQEYYPTALNLGLAKQHKFKYGFKVLTSSICSKEACNLLDKFLKDIKIDIVQLNTIHYGLTPGIIRVIKKYCIPIVWRIIDYSIVCPNIRLMHGGKLCSECLGNKFYNCIISNCKKDVLAGFVSTFQAYFYKWRGDFDLVDMFSFQNKYMLNLFVEKCGYLPEKCISINNPYDSLAITPETAPGDYVLYFGRIDPEKGVMTFVKTAEINKDIKYVIVGKGAVEDEMKKYIQEHQLDNVQFLGPVWGDDMNKILRGCSFVVVPSEWHEPSPYVILQAFANGKPVVGSRMGGIPEIVEDQKQGLLFNYKDIDDLAVKIKQLYNNKEQIQEMGANALSKVHSNYSEDFYYTKTIILFEKLINNYKK